MFVADDIMECDMPRHLDLTALRSFITVSETGGVTRAANQLNLTQSAVSMQLKRLEEALGQPLIDRSGRGVALTAQGEQLVTYGRRLIALNDELWGRMTNQEFEGELHLGVPHDIIYPHVPRILQRFAAEYPRMKVQLHSSNTADLKPRHAQGELDVILTTEAGIDAGGETLESQPLVWCGAHGGQAWRARPLRLATVTNCLFKHPAIAALEASGLDWELAVTSVSTTAVEASVSADLAIQVLLAGSKPQHCEVIAHGGALPPLPDYSINMYVATGARQRLAERLASFVRTAYCCGGDRIAAE
jgi:DNA-binding transcriptional LysR family regulator